MDAIYVTWYNSLQYLFPSPNDDNNSTNNQTNKTRRDDVFVLFGAREKVRSIASHNNSNNIQQRTSQTMTCKDLP